MINLREKKRPDLRAWARLAALLRRRRIDVLQAHIAYSVAAGRLVGRAMAVPAVVTTLQTMPWQVGPGILRILDATIRLPHANVYISRADYRAQADRHPHLERLTPVIIPNGIDTPALRQAASGMRAAVRAELGIADGDFAFANVARLVTDKGQETLLRAFRIVLDRHPEARLFIVGVGPLEAELKALSETLGISARMTFLGLRLDVPRLLSGFDAYVHPSIAEALGIAALEAMALGLPTVGAAVDGLTEFVREGETGFLFPPRNSAALATRMSWLASRPDEARSAAERGRDLIERDYDIRGSVRAYERVYDEVLARQGLG